MSEQTETLIDKLKWYAASALIATRWRDAPNECPLVEERVYLIQATNDDEALKKAAIFAEVEAEKDFRFEYEGRLAREEFLGIRKLITIRSHINDAGVENDEPRDGSELTFSYFQLDDKNDLRALVDGESVRLIYKADPRPE